MEFEYDPLEEMAGGKSHPLIEVSDVLQQDVGCQVVVVTAHCFVALVLIPNSFSVNMKACELAVFLCEQDLKTSTYPLSIQKIIAQFASLV